jgi:hypothetical protein
MAGYPQRKRTYDDGYGYLKRFALYAIYRHPEGSTEVRY